MVENGPDLNHQCTGSQMKKVMLRAAREAANEIRMSDSNVIMFSNDVERIDNMLNWLFSNTQKRFVLIGTDTVYFEDDDDAAHFMMVWG